LSTIVSFPRLADRIAPTFCSANSVMNVNIG
jgi:hypothetical protein